MKTGAIAKKRGKIMSLYIIGDLHLSFSKNEEEEEKPMNIFGNKWDEHSEKIKKDWLEKVKPEDTVILAGDFSWATYLDDAFADFSYLNSLPGRKIMLKGNHDYWWTTITSMKNFLKDNNIKNVEFLYNNSFEIENRIIVGTRGWALTDSENAEKMINRETSRLELSIKSAIEQFGEKKEIICIMHYPPISKQKMKNEYMYNSKFLDVMKQYNIKKCYYAHLHGKAHNEAIEGNVEGIEFKLISSDYLNFKLYEIKE